MSEIGINEKQIKYLEKFSRKYTAKQLKLGTELINEIYNKKNKPVTTSEELNITPEIVDKYLELFNEKKNRVNKRGFSKIKTKLI